MYRLLGYQTLRLPGRSIWPGFSEISGMLGTRCKTGGRRLPQRAGVLLVALLALGFAATVRASVPSASPASAQAEEYRHEGSVEGSTAIAVDGTYMLVGDDEDNIIRLYQRRQNGGSVKEFDLSSNLGATKIDIEGSTPIWQDGRITRIYWIASHSNTGSGSIRPARYQLFATDLQVDGANTELQFVDSYTGLRTYTDSTVGGDLINWGDGQGYDFTAKAAEGQNPELSDGFNVEGLAVAPDNTTLYIGFRAPLIDNQALIAPLQNASALIAGSAPSAVIGDPILLDLGGRGIRSIERSQSGEYLIVAGPPGQNGFRLFRWSGEKNAQPQEVTLADSLDSLRGSGSFEGIVDVPTPICGTTVQLLVDDGDSGLGYFRSYDIGLPVCGTPPQADTSLYLPMLTRSTGSSLPAPASALVALGATWKYLDNGSDLGNGWQQPGYDDSSWASGPAPLGYGDGVATEVGFGGNPTSKHITTYFRHAFSVTSPADYRTFSLNLRRDDGAVVYLNGAEVYRSNMPLGPITYQTPATDAIGGADESRFHEAMIDASLLQPGSNLLAVEIHQDNASSSDISFDLSLTPASLVTLVPARSQWRYLDKGIDPGTTWRETSFDDSGWASGAAPLGYGDPVNTQVGFGPNPNNKYITTYFRRTFPIVDPGLFQRLELAVLRDDGAVVYLNGTEIFRSNMPDETSNQTPAVSVIGGVEETVFHRQTVNASLLRPGENVLAVEVHQADPTSSDMRFDLSLRSVPASDGVRFAVVGDFGVDNENQLAAAQLLSSWAPEFIVTVGDNLYSSRSYDTVVGKYYCAFLKEIEAGASCAGNNGSANRFFPATGNHDYTDGGGIDAYLAYFKSLPGSGVQNPNPSGSRLYYDFVQGAVHFFVVDSQGAMSHNTMDAQKAWLEQGLAASTTAWQIVVLHHPPYSSNQHGNTVAMQWPYAAWGADLVLTGHDHNYERISQNGIIYIVNGAGGASLRPFKTIVSGSEARNQTDYGAQWIVADSCHLSSQFVGADGRVVDQFVLDAPTCN